MLGPFSWGPFVGCLRCWAGIIELGIPPEEMIVDFRLNHREYIDTSLLIVMVNSGEFMLKPLFNDGESFWPMVE